jgi:hypothetical protein
VIAAKRGDSSAAAASVTFHRDRPPSAVVVHTNSSSRQAQTPKVRDNAKRNGAQLSQEIQLARDHPQRHADQPSTGLPALADDSSLHVCAHHMLNWQQSVYWYVVYAVQPESTAT